jgi:uncharacterized RDD family membrane protein YckC
LRQPGDAVARATAVAAEEHAHVQVATKTDNADYADNPDVHSRPHPRFCGRCGAELAPQVEFCNRCGQPVRRAPSGSAAAASVAGSTNARSAAAAQPPPTAGAHLTVDVAPAPPVVPERPAAVAPAGGILPRLLALIIDVSLLNVAAHVVAGVLGSGSGDPSVAQALLWPVFAIVGLLYFAFMESSPGQATIGKRALAVYVVGADGTRLTFKRAVGRYVAKYASSTLFGLGFLMAALSDRRLTLHDRLAATRVCKRA